MSRGWGVVQRAIIAALQERAENESAPPLTWFEREALGFQSNGAARSSFSRAAIGLQRAGVIERGLVGYRSKPSTNVFYRHARAPIHPDDIDEMWFQGERWHLVIRLVPSEEQRNELAEMRNRWKSMPTRSGELFHLYAKWLFSPEQFVWPDDPGVIQLPSEASLEAVRRVISDSALGL